MARNVGAPMGRPSCVDRSKFLPNGMARRHTEKDPEDDKVSPSEAFCAVYWPTVEEDYDNSRQVEVGPQIDFDQPWKPLPIPTRYAALAAERAKKEAEAAAKQAAEVHNLFAKHGLAAYA